MLLVFSVILEYPMDSRNSSDMPTVRSMLLNCMCILHSRDFKASPKHVHLYSVEPYQLQLITEHALRRAQMLNRYKEIEITYFVDLKYIQKQRN